MAPSASTLACAALLAAVASSAASADFARIHKRATVTTPNSLAGATFDYVIVGGGTAGLVVANRLSANSSVTVAVIEAGLDGSAVQDDIDMPAQAYFDGIASMTSDYDWHYNTAQQSELNKTVYWPRGRVLGGSSAVNGLYLIRGSKEEHDSWAALNSAPSTWGWDAIWPYMSRSENYTAPLPANAELANVVVDESAHGKDGPIHFSYPGFFYEQTMGSWIDTLGNLGVETRDPGRGQSYGVFVATSAIDPSTYKRSYSKTGYLDPVETRSNLVVLTGYQATKIVLDGTTATGVQFAASAAGPSYTVSASREVILSAGVIGTPQLLQLSGIGDSAHLGGLGITVVKDLPGVGQHLTDHLSSQITFDTTGVDFTGDMVTQNATFAAEQKALWEAIDPTSLYNAPNSAVAYVNMTTLFGGQAAAEALMTEIKSVKDAQVNSYSTNTAVRAGYAAGYQAEVDDILMSSVGQAEILLSNTGTYGAYGDVKTVSIQAAIQHPLSRGTVLINSTSAFDAPVIDPGYLTHPADIQILRQAFKFARTVSQTAPLSQYLTTELSPGPAVSTDAEWETFIRGAVSTEYHPAGSASMLTESMGGVVDTAMRVYGISGLRVVDSSMVPVGMSAHMVAPLYGIAELASEILTTTPITAGGVGVQAAASPSTSSGSSSSATRSSTSNAASATPSTSQSATSGASTLVASILGSSFFALVVAFSS